MRKTRYILQCGCGASSGDIRTNPKAWNGWQVSPAQICPACIQSGLESKGFRLVKTQVGGKVMNTLVLIGTQGG